MFSSVSVLRHRFSLNTSEFAEAGGGSLDGLEKWRSLKRSETLPIILRLNDETVQTNKSELFSLILIILIWKHRLCFSLNLLRSRSCSRVRFQLLGCFVCFVSQMDFFSDCLSKFESPVSHVFLISSSAEGRLQSAAQTWAPQTWSAEKREKRKRGAQSELTPLETHHLASSISGVAGGRWWAAVSSVRGGDVKFKERDSPRELEIKLFPLNFTLGTKSSRETLLHQAAERHSGRWMQRRMIWINKVSLSPPSEDQASVQMFLCFWLFLEGGGKIPQLMFASRIWLRKRFSVSWSPPLSLFPPTLSFFITVEWNSASDQT